MTSTYSTSLRLELMATGDQSGTWGDTTNTNLGTLLEQAITGVLSVAEGDTTLTLTSVNGGSDQARNAVVNLTGAMTGAHDVVVPTANKVYLVKNSTTGGYAVTVKTAAGTGVAIPPGTARWVYCDGTNVVDGQSGPWTPSTNDGAALGLAAVAWSDLFLASGGVINWNAGDTTLTQSSGNLALGGSATDVVFDLSGANAGQIKFPATQNASADANMLDDYQEGSFTATLTGCTTSPTGTVNYTKNGNTVTISFPAISATSNSTAATLTGFPTRIRPASQKVVLARISDNSTSSVGLLRIETDGTATLFPVSGGNFTSSGTKGISGFNASYLVV